MSAMDGLFASVGFGFVLSVVVSAVFIVVGTIVKTWHMSLELQRLQAKVTQLDDWAKRPR